MINKSACLLFCALILLTLSSCLPAVELEHTQQATKTAVHLPSPPSPSPMSQEAEKLTMPADPFRQPSATAEEELADPPAVQPSLESTLQPAAQNWVNQAKEDLAMRLELSTVEIEFLSFESKEWPDNSLGCPQPGLSYMQVVQKGTLIRLRAGKVIYHYHGSGDVPPFLCPQPGPEITITRHPPFNLKQTPTISVPPPRD